MVTLTFRRLCVKSKGILTDGKRKSRFALHISIGQTNVYNPWSVISYIDTAISDFSAFPRAYWSNTSSNSIVRELIDQTDSTAKKEIENLIAGGSIEKSVHEEITYDDIHKTQENLWNFLFFTGYLKMNQTRMQNNTIYLTLSIPNEEVRYIYQNTIREWFEQKIKVMDLHSLYEAILSGNCRTFEDFVKTQLRQSISYFDSSESFYHGFMLGLLKPLENHEIKSNSECSEGRSDILLIPMDETRPAVILEFKTAFVLYTNACPDFLSVFLGQAFIIYVRSVWL